MTRTRAFVRAAVGWVLIVLGAVVLWHDCVLDVTGGNDTEFDTLEWIVVPAVAWLAGVVSAAYDPRHGPQDHIAGTYLVPR